MKISFYWEDPTQKTVLDVPDSECEIWVEDDYNRPNYNNEHKETRRCVSYPEEEFLKPEYPELYAALKKLLPRQQELE